MTNQILKLLEWLIREHYFLHQELLPETAKHATSPDQIKVQLADHFDLISGVSGGSWLALYYASKGGNGASAKVFNQKYIIRKYGHLYPGCAKGIDVFFIEFAKKIYPPGQLCIIPEAKLSMRGFCAEADAPPPARMRDFPVWRLEKTLKLFYGNTKLSELDTATAVYAFDVDFRNPVLFVYNRIEDYSAAELIQSRDGFILPGEGQKPQQHTESSRQRYLDIRQEEDFYIRDLGRASSAFPGIHASKSFTAINNKTAKYDCVDGAMVGPNPTLNSLSFILSMETMNKDRKNSDTKIDMVRRIATLSLGSGAVVGNYSLDSKNYTRWFTSGDLQRVIIDGGSEVVQANLHYAFYDLLEVKEDQFLRIQPITNDTSCYAAALNSITDVCQLCALKEIGEMVAMDYTDTLRTFVRDFIFAEEKDPK